MAHTLAKNLVCASGLALLALWCGPAVAQDEDLQAKLANPVADLITLPFQVTSTFNSGPLDKQQHTLNIQPVYPASLGEINLINRLIVPLLSNPGLGPGQDRVNGLGDILYQGFLSPRTPGRWIWGAGPALQMRTATDDRLGTGKWSAGPTLVGLTQPHPWTFGALVTQLWSFAGDDSRQRVNQTQIQPILSYTLNPRNSIAYAGVITANWEEDRSSQRWTVPLGATYSILTKPAGFVPVNYIFGGGYNIIHPDNVGTWFLRFQVNFILPK